MEWSGRGTLFSCDVGGGELFWCGGEGLCVALLGRGQFACCVPVIDFFGARHTCMCLIALIVFFGVHHMLIYLIELNYF